MAQEQKPQPQQQQHSKSDELSEEETKAVLMWLRDLMKYVSANPLIRGPKALEEIKKNKDLIIKSIKTALEPEFKDYADLIAGALNALEAKS